MIGVNGVEPFYAPVMPATAHATWSSSWYIFSLRTPTAEVSSNCRQQVGCMSPSAERLPMVPDEMSQLVLEMRK